MCSIMCYVGTLTEKESEAFLPKFTEGFEKTKSRGPDMSEVPSVRIRGLRISSTCHHGS